MEYMSLINSIKRGVIAPVYLFFGTEKLLMEQSLTRLKGQVLPEGLEAFNYDKLDAEKLPLGQIIDVANTMPVMSEKRVVIVENAYFFSAQKGNETKIDDSLLLAYLANPNTNTCLVFKILGKADKRKKIFKAMEEKGQTIEFISPTGEQLERWIQAYLNQFNKKLAPDAFNYLAILAKEGLDILQKELDKLVTFGWNEAIITLPMVQEITTKNSEINVFNLVDQIAERNGKKALELMQTTLAMGEAPLKLIHLLVRQFRMIIIAKDLVSQGFSEKQIREKLQVQPFILGKVLGQGRKFTMEQLVEALGTLLEVEVQLKSGGGQPAELMENLVLNIVGVKTL
ncbi:MAG: DNA polymerase III subunit delta [Bacillota bacterium]